ncbi:RNI-like protein [Flammula alnicola]|nr:RNI-like protein [Flammula alnicola]
MTLGKEPRSYPPAWYTASKPLVSSATAEARTAVAPNASPFGLLKGKARSKSSPYPISALDYVPVASSDIFQPLPIVVLNYFDLILPKELRLHILRALVDLHEQDYSRSIREGRLTMARATSSKGRWVGRDKGVRELFKLSRVSKAWKALVFDGELWTDLDLRSFSGLPPALLVRLVKSARTFIRSLDFAGHVQLLPDAMSDITNNLCLTIPEISLPYTQLTTINFQGCTLLTTRSLHHLFVRSKSLRTLSLKGLSAVTNTTCDIIANFCPQLTSLNVSRCPNVDGHGISALTVSAILRREHLPLKELHLSGLKHVSDSMMQALGRAAPYLEVLDLSYARQLHNSALEAFVACDTQADQQLAVETVIVSARDLGRDANESGKFRRRVTRLRHLVLSSCILLSDTACSNLAHSVPKLEFLELAGIGGDLKDDGLVRLLSTTPYIRRLDLEDASDITDSLLATITPASASEATANAANKEAAEQPGQALQQLNISFAANVTDSALLALMRNCTRLTILEADNTRIGPHVLKEFINLSRQRKAINSRIVVIDCRGISESLVKELSPMTRPRLGWRAYGARKLMYLDARDDNEEDLKLGQDECDESRVVLKTFYSWQTVDAVQAAKEKRRKTTSRRTASDSSTGTNDQEGVMIGRSARWWSPGGRRATVGTIGRGRNSPPVLPELNNDGCRTM